MTNLDVVATLAPLLIHIMSTYFINLDSVMVVYDDFMLFSQLGDFYMDSLNDALVTKRNAKTPDDNILVLHWMHITNGTSDDEYSKLIFDNVEIGLQGYITVVKDLDRFLRIKSEVQQISIQRIQDRIFLFLCEMFDPILLEHPAFDLYPNHLLVSPSVSDGLSITSYSFEMWTQQFWGPDGTQTPILLDTYFIKNDSFANNNNLYLDKIHNLMGRVMRVATVTYIPYSMVDYVPAGTGMYDDINSTESKTIMYDGTESRLVQEFCRLRNCTLRLLPFPGDYWGGIVNGTGDGQIGAVYDGDVEFAIGCIYKWYYDVFDLTQSIAKSAVTLLVPGALPLSYALTPILPFTGSTWLFLFVTMHICVVLYYIIKYFSEWLSHKDDVQRLADVKRSEFKTSFRKTYLEVIAVFLQQGFDQGTSRVAVRTVYCVLLISGITLENAYSGGLKALLTVPRYHDKIETSHDFVLTGFKWGAPQPAWAYSIRLAQAADDLAMFQRFEAHPDEILRNKSFSRNYGIGIERLHAGSYSFYDYVQMDTLQKQDMLREDVYYDYTNGYAVRGWPLMAHFDQIAMQVVAHGLLNRWETEIINNNLNLTTENYLRQMATGYSETAGPEVLRVVHIFGPMVMLAIGIVAASLSFGGEHLYWRWQLRKEVARNEEAILRLNDYGAGDENQSEDDARSSEYLV